MPVALSRETVEAWAKALPELPRQRRERFVSQYGLPDYDARVLVADKAVADYYEEAVKHGAGAKAVSNWVMTRSV